jgi:hypothetical protein
VSDWKNYPHPLAAEHIRLLDASGISPEVARRRGVRAVTTKKETRDVGMRGDAERPGLWLPRWTTRGDQDGGQLRSDSPRVDPKGHLVKYETPKGQKGDLDIHPDSRAHLRDPAVPLVITEGVRKADACWGILEIPAVSLAGVWSWRGADISDGVLGLAAWEDIAFKNTRGEPRQVFIVFDSDVMTKRQVAQACRRLGVFLEARGAEVFFVVLPPGDHGTKTGLDDYLAANHSWSDLLGLGVVAPPLPPEPGPAAGEDTYDDVPEESGAELLDDVTAFFRRFVVFRNDHQAVACAAWVLHTHCLHAFRSTPRLVFCSPSMQSGKTRGLEVCEVLVPRPELLANVTGAYLFRSIAVRRPVLLLDEADSIFSVRSNGDTTAQDIRGIVNSGYREGGSVGRCVGQGSDQRPVRFPTFAPVALAGIGALPPTIMDRAVVIRMRRRGAAEPVEPFEVTEPPPEAAFLARRMAAWAARHNGALRVRPEMPKGVVDRLAEVWRPFFAISAAAGGEWPRRTALACQALRGARDEVEKESLGVALLADIRDISRQKGKSNIHTADLVTELVSEVDSPWRDLGRGEPLNATRLAAELRSFDIVPKNVRVGEVVRKGYAFTEFADAWSRYLPADKEEEGGTQPPPPFDGVTGVIGVTPLNRIVTSVTPVTPIEGVGEDLPSALPDHDPHGVGRDESGMVKL